MMDHPQSYVGLREAEFSQERFLALQAGRTGWPMVDACVAMLRETGWLNFRMRAMLVSVAAYPLWLHWQPCKAARRGEAWGQRRVEPDRQLTLDI